MYALRAKVAAEPGIRLIVHKNPEAEAKGINPFDHGALHTDMWKTQGLRQALEAGQYDAAFGGARRDEEKSRAKERVVSLRSKSHRWDPRAQRPELWSLYNLKMKPGESLRVFPLSNWTELDVWRYVEREGIEVVPLYFAAERPVVERDGLILLVDDARFRLAVGEEPVMRQVRFRTLGCYPLTGAVDSDASDIAAVVAEMERATTSERQNRAIDRDGGDHAMERKKQEGYF
jgi:sulfate adenylyltransferase subunit 2